MPPIPIIAPTIVRFSMQHNTPTGHPAHCVVDVSLDEIVIGRESAVEDLVPTMVSTWQDKISRHMQLSFPFTGCRWLDLDSIDGQGGFEPPDPGMPVASASDAAMQLANTSFLVHKQCTHNRRQRDGRMYLPGVAEGDVANNGDVTTVVRSAWETRFTALKEAIADTDFFEPGTTAWRVVHVEGHTGVPEPGYPNGKPNAWSSSDVSSVSIDARAATQRRRLRS